MKVSRIQLLALALSLMAGPTVFAETGGIADGAGCGTQTVWLSKLGEPLDDAQACFSNGPCDQPGTRNSYIPDSTDPMTFIRMVVHILRNDDGTNPISNDLATQTIIDNLNNDFLASRIQFEVTVNYVNSTQWRNLTEAEISGMKAATAIKPDSFLNVWATTVAFGYSYGTFPWDPASVTSQGGIVMGHFHWNITGDVFAHEVGHCLGLWHTFNGVDETTTCGSCYEAVNSPEPDVRGDRCSDTEPAPTTSGCTPSGTDPCSGLSWGAAFNNIHSYMSYSACTEFFTPQQMGRMLCWSNSALSGLIANVRIDADVQVGKVPFDVTFNGLTAKTVNSWDWDFGDGGSGVVQQPVHTYSTPGLYDVSVTINATDGIFTTIESPFVAAHDDSLRPLDETASPGDTAFVEIWCRNFIPVNDLKVPFTWVGPFNMNLVDIRTTGLRSDGMGTKQITSFLPGSSQAAFRLEKGGGSALLPGNGPIMTLVFEVPVGASGGPNPVTVGSYSGQTLRFYVDVGDYEPTVLSGQVSVGVCGDVNGNGAGPTVADLTYLVNFLFNSGPVPPNANMANVNGVAGVTVADLTYLVSHLFNGGPDPNCP